MKKYIFFLCSVILFFSCQEDNYDIPRDENGNAVLTGVSSATTSGISTLDDQFTVDAVLPNANSGDEMTVECLQLQTPPSGGETKQLLPLAGTQKTVTVSGSLTASISYSRSEANLNNAGDYVTVTFAGDTEYALQRVDMTTATSTTKPMVAGVEVDVARNNEVAYFNVTVSPKMNAYTGTLTVQRKNGVNETFVDMPGSPFSGTQPFLVPISGTDFAAGKDTMYYKFIAQQSGYTDVIETNVIVRDPYFFLKKTATLVLGSTSESGRNLLINEAVGFDDAKAMIAIKDSLMLIGGPQWLNAGYKIGFVATTLDMYSANNSNDAIASYEAGTPVIAADPIAGDGVYIFKAVNGPYPEDVYYGMIKVTNVIPGISVTFEYRIGNMYAHLAVIE